MTLNTSSILCLKLSCDRPFHVTINVTCHAFTIIKCLLLFRKKCFICRNIIFVANLPTNRQSSHICPGLESPYSQSRCKPFWTDQELCLHMSTRWYNRVFYLFLYKILALMAIPRTGRDMHCQLDEYQESVEFRLCYLSKAKISLTKRDLPSFNLTLALRISFGSGLKVFAISPIGCSKSRVKSNSIPSFTFIGRMVMLNNSSMY